MKYIKEIWTVETGCYSDHRVLAVFMDEKTANDWADALKSEHEGWSTDAVVGRISLVETGAKPERVTTYSQYVELWDNGTTETRGIKSSTEYPISSYSGPPPSRPKVRYVRAPIHNDQGGRLEVVGASEKAVSKAVNDRIAMWKAGVWGGSGRAEIVE